MQTAAELAASRIERPEDVAHAGHTLVAHSAPMAEAERDIKAFLFSHMYRHPEVNRRRLRAIDMVHALFGAYLAAPEEMTPIWTRRARESAPERAAADYIAGMTDRFAFGEYQRLFDPTASLR